MHDTAQDILRHLLDEGVALPFATLVLRMRRRGAAVNEGVLERWLRADDSGVRLLNPWCGPHEALRRMTQGPANAEKAGLWVVPEESLAERSGRPRPHGPTTLLRALRCLGRDLDERSPRDVARWMALVEEARQLRRPAA